MKVNTLLRELDATTDDIRMRRMVELGKLAATDAAIAKTLDALEAGGFFERMLALQSCYGSGNGPRIVRFLADPSRTLRGRARTLLVRFGSDEEVRQSLSAARAEGRIALLGRLRPARRWVPIDAFLDDLADREPAALVALLPYGSRAAVARHLAAVRDRCGDLFWKRLARLQPDEAARAIGADLNADPTPGPRLLHEAILVLTGLVGRAPDPALGLATALAAHLPLGRLLPGLQTLVARRPNGVADLLLASADAVHLSFDAVAHRLDGGRLEALHRRRPTALAYPASWLRKLDPATRAALVATFERQWRDAEGCAPLAVVAALPALPRRAEALRNLALPALATRPAQRLPYVAYLGWDEALALLDPWLKHPEGDLRGLAFETLAGAVRYERLRLADLLALAVARKHEQDPVRCRMLAGLAGLPPGAWRPEHLEPLGRVIRDALSASDLSGLTSLHAQSLVVALLRFHPAWAAEWLGTLARERGHIYLGDLQDRLNEADVRRIAPFLLPVLRSWQNRERQGQLIGFAQSIGRRLPVFPGLVDILEKEVQVSRTEWLAESILTLFAKHCKGRMADLVPKLVKADPSWATRAVVYQHLHRRRQDLLTPFLGQKAYKGRFSTGRTRFVLPLDSGFFRWTPTQQATFEKTLHELTSAKTDPTDTPTILRAIAQLAGLPAVDVGPLARLAADARPAVQEGTLRVLGRLDAGQGVPILLGALGDDRARVAIYVLRSAILAMPTGEAVALLRGVPVGKVTVAKEVLRLLGDIPSPAAFAELQRLSGTALHRDVRIALLRALWGHLDRPEAWAILDEAGRSPDAAVMDGVVRIPADGLAESARTRLSTLLLRLLEHPEPLIRLQILQRFVSLPVGDPDGTLLPALLAKLPSTLPDERQAAATALFATCRSQDAARIEGAFAALLPNRRALAAALQSLGSAVRADLRRLLPVARGVLDALALDPLTAVPRVRLAMAALPWDELARLLKAMASDRLGPDVLAACVDDLGSRTDGADLARLEAALASSGDERLRRLALAALVARASLAEGWTEECWGRLEAYRRDESLLVAAAAQFTFPAGEEETRAGTLSAGG